MRAFYLFVLFSFNAVGTTCMISEQTFEEWNEKYDSMINVEIKKSTDGESYAVLATFPSTIENKLLSSVLLYLGKKDQPTFSSQLAIFEEDGKKAVFYTTNLKQGPNGYLIAGYGSDCGLDVGKPVVLSK